jgi:hypothetical protein
MANSLIFHKEKKLWIHDDLFIILLYFLSNEILKTLPKCKNISKSSKDFFYDYVSQLNFFMEGNSSGAIDLELDSFSSDDEKLNFFRVSLIHTINEINKLGDSITCSFLNKIENKRIGDKILWKEPLRTDVLIKLINDITALLN